jgi:hypothetical protein
MLSFISLKVVCFVFIIVILYFSKFYELVIDCGILQKYFSGLENQN